MKLTELIARAPWREAVTYRDTWPHEYVLSKKDGQRELLNAIYARFQDGEGVACRFFRVSNKYLFIGDFKYWFNSLVASDIRQLRGLAQRQDDEAFQPMKTAEFSPSVPRRLQGLNRLIDDVVDSRGCPEGWMSVEGFRATAQRDGYGRYFGFTTDQR